MKSCNRCGALGVIAGRRICKSCQAVYMKAYHAAHRDRKNELNRNYHAEKTRSNPLWVKTERERTKEYWRRLRLEIMDAYGGRRCACCGESNQMFLSVDHINGDGAQHRRQLGYTTGNGRGGSSRTMQWIKQNNFPPGFQVLCFNCNHGKHVNGGTCPHKAGGVDSRLLGPAERSLALS